MKTLKLFAVGVLLLGFGRWAAAQETKPAADRPNILFFFADDWGRYASAYAAIESRPSINQIVKTPNFDRIAREGILFKNAFVNSPSCTPCRSALLSGRYFYNTGRGAILRGAIWDPAIPSFPLLLRDAGYHIGETGKVWSPGRPVDAPFGAGKYAYEKAGGQYNNYSENATMLASGGATLTAARDRILTPVRANFDAFLAAGKPAQPWLYWFGPTTTHRTWIKGSGKALWNIDPDQLKGKLPKFLPDVPEIREDVADYLGEVQALDAYLGVLLERLEKSGDLARTLIVVSGDHGMPGVPWGKCNLYDHGTGVALLARWPGGKGGRVVDDFVNLMDLAPTFMEVGGVKPPPGVNGRSLLNVLRSDKSGQVDPERTWVLTGRERHVDTAREDNLPYPMRALRTSEFLYIRNFKPDRWPLGSPGGVTATMTPTAQALETNTFVAFADMDASPTKAWLIAHRNDSAWQPLYEKSFGKRPGEELYDLKKDPDQLVNVAADPAYARMRQQLAQRLMQVLTDTGDPRLSDTFDRPPFTDVEAKQK